jgi:hypothetical protein
MFSTIRLGWKGLSETNTLAYKENSKITDVKSFITLGPGFEGLPGVKYFSLNGLFVQG